MSNVLPLDSGKWPVDSVPNEEFCKVAADFLVSLWPDPEKLNSDEGITFDDYDGPGIWITAKYLAYWFLDQGPAGLTSNGPADIPTATQLVNYWLQIEQSDVETYNAYVMPIITDCTASVCRALGWEGNSDIAGIGVGVIYDFFYTAGTDIFSPDRSLRLTTSKQSLPPCTCLSSSASALIGSRVKTEYPKPSRAPSVTWSRVSTVYSTPIPPTGSKQEGLMADIFFLAPASCSSLLHRSHGRLAIHYPSCGQRQ